jgi:hypothetical protein
MPLQLSVIAIKLNKSYNKTISSNAEYDKDITVQSAAD